MTTRSIEVPLHRLAAVQMLAAVKDIRSYLCGVAFDPLGYMVATNGRYMMAARAPGFAGIAGWQDGSAIIVPNAPIMQAVKSVKPSRRSLTMATITFTPQGEKGEEAPTVAIAVAGAEFRDVALDGRYPDWRKVIPTKYSTVAEDKQMLDPELLMHCRDALRVFYDHPKALMYVTQPTSRGAVVRLEAKDDSREITVLMPARVMRTNDEIADETTAKVAAFMKPSA